LLGDDFQLSRGLCVALVVDQDARIRKAQWHGVFHAGNHFLQQDFGLAAAHREKFEG
jgi:hypothetical protein